MRKLYRTGLLLALLTLAGRMLTSCVGGEEIVVREVTPHVMLYYVAGYNDLSNYLREDVQDLLGSDYIPGDGQSDNILLIFSKLAVTGTNFSTPVPPSLTRVYRRRDGTVVQDTVKTWSSSVPASEASTIRSVLTSVRELFPARDYGMVFTSHATGWVPFGYYINPVTVPAAARRIGRIPYNIYSLPEEEPGLPAVKSIGRDLSGSASPYTVTDEMEVEEFAQAIPYRLKYVLFDACLMGGIEMAYALRDKCDYFGASQTEVLADGFNYRTLSTRLLSGSSPDPQGVCEDYFTQYETRSGQWQSATISLVDCRELDSLARVCRRLFDKYRTALQEIDAAEIQPFGRYHSSREHNWYYDLEDILIQAGITADEKRSLQGALGQCIVYEAHTPYFLGIQISASCGLSMYLPSAGNAYLDSYYRERLSWNLATGLVE